MVWTKYKFRCQCWYSFEFRYRKIKFKKDCLYVFVSQSGETADTFAALDLCKKNNVKTCAVVNVVESSIARDADLVLPIHCGPKSVLHQQGVFRTNVILFIMH